jgi:predicted nucleic acid-binding protein
LIVIDTNVLSGLMRAGPETMIIRWLDGQPRESVWTTSITVYEIRFGIELLAAGRKRQLLEDALQGVVDLDLEGRVLPFDASAAHAAAAIAAEQRGGGRIVEIRDVQIAGIARARKATLATRNIKHFERIGLTLVNPWSGE